MQQRKFMIGVQDHMKTHSHNALILMTTSLLFFSGYAASEASSSAQSRRAAVKGSGVVQPVRGGARLIIRRSPDLGNYVHVNLYVDGVAAATIGYGSTYEGLLPPGRHVLSVVATPNPKWPNPWEMTLDVRSGQTYSFTAEGDSGYLILRAPGGPERPRGR
jgi:hypothetical protein